MTNKRSTKRALLLSIMSMMLCIAMLAGTTFAWFTDSVTSANNKIAAGNLAVDLEVLGEDGKWVSVKDSKAPIFNYTNWEPGYTQVKFLKIDNEGSLDLKWKAKLVTTQAAQEVDLAEVIDVYVKEFVYDENNNPAMPDRAFTGWTKLDGTLRDFIDGIEESTNGTLAANTSDVLGIAFKMQESADNKYQSQMLGAFDILILATQNTFEKDSFDEKYDEDARFGTASLPTDVPANATEDMTLKTSTVEVTLPAELINNLPDEVTAVQVVHTDPTVDTANGRVVFGSVELVDQNGDEIDLDALNNAEDITVTLPVGDVFAANQAVKIYHDGVWVDDAVVDANGNITYSALHFCVVTVTEKVNVIVTFTDGYTKKFDTLKAAMRYGYSGGAQEKITVYEDLTEEMSYLEGNIVCGKEGGVTIKNTIVDAWIYCGENFTIGEGVTYDATGYASGLFVYAEDAVINGHVITDCYYQRYADTKLTINAPGSMTVTTETFILRYTDGDGEAGIYVNGDNDDSTVELKLAVAYFYQGMISAKDATLVVGTYWQTNETDGEGSANLVLDNSKLTVTVNEHNFKATGNSTVTLKNGSVLDVAGGIQTTNEIVADATSVVKKAR